MSYQKNKGIFLLTLFAIGFLFFTTFSSSNDLRVIFLDVGQGDAILIQTPLGKNIIVDTGPRNNLDEKISHYMESFERSIDMLILTHPDLDHVGGTLNILNRYHVKLLGHSGLLAGSQMYETIALRVQQKNIPTLALERGHVIDIEPGVVLYIYTPAPDTRSFDANDFSLVMKLVYYNTSVLLTGDASKTTEYEIAQVYQESIQSDILKVGHHGSQTSTSINFLEKVQPKYGIISAGCNNSFGHPHAEVLSNLFRFGINVLDTCSQGDIIFESNGEEWIQKHKN